MRDLFREEGKRVAGLVAVAGCDVGYFKLMIVYCHGY